MAYTAQQEHLLEELFLGGAVLVGDEVREQTGLHTPIYFNLRKPLHGNAALLWKVGREFAEKIRELAGEDGPTQCLVGVPDAATPLATAAVLYAAKEFPQPQFSSGLLRKEPAGSAVPFHFGAPRLSRMVWIGPRDPSCEYILIDDVIASGLTKRAAAAAMREAGIAPTRVVVLFDRGQGDGLRDDGYELHGIFTALDAARFYQKRGWISAAACGAIEEFLATHRFDSIFLK